MPAGRQVGTWPRSLLPQLGEDRLLLLKTHFMGKPSSGRNRDMWEGQWGADGVGDRRWCLSQNLLRKQHNGGVPGIQFQLL